MMIMGFSSGQYISQLLQFLELQPKYECSLDEKFTNVFSCEPHPSKDHPGFCGNSSIHYQVNWDEEVSLHNWFDSLELTCVSKSRIGLLGSSLFIGWASAATILPRLSDLYGRKKIFVLSMMIQTVSFLGFFFSRNIDAMTAFMFLFGVASVGRCSISYLYLMDLLPANR